MSEDAAFKLSSIRHTECVSCRTIDLHLGPIVQTTSSTMEGIGRAFQPLTEQHREGCSILETVKVRVRPDSVTITQ